MLPDTEKDLKFTLIFRGEAFELSTEGSLEDIDRKLPDIREFVQKFNELFNIEIIEASPTVEEIQQVSSEDVPVIRLSRSNSENIIAILKTEWGKKGRTSAEIVKALEINAVPIPPNQMSVYLHRLVKRGDARRIQNDQGVYAYYLRPE